MLDSGEGEALRDRAAMADLVVDGTQRRIFKPCGAGISARRTLARSWSG
ncbi:hypothetical protein [Massilia sp. ST3]|nr:hypothetical protein [Massilia sp. ST3]MBQ5946913.1 hypothetical protein [Massilia sp. ST3]